MHDLDAIYQDCLRRIRQNDLPSPLQSEWALAKRFGVSRAAARRVMQRLVREGLAFSVRGKGYFPRPGPRRSTGVADLRIAIVYEEAAGGGREPQNRMLRSLIQAAGRQRLDAQLLPLPAVADRSSLASILRTAPCQAFLLYSLPPVIQSQFAAQARPAVVFGNTYADLSLPSVALDELEITRQICQDLLADGHRCVALVQHRSQNLGAERSRIGFIYAHHAQRRRFNNDRVVLVDRRRGTRPSLRHLALLHPSALIVQNAELLGWLWEMAGAQQRREIASLEIAVLSGQRADLPFGGPRIVRADLDAAARAVARVLRGTLHARPAEAHHHSIPWRLDAALK